MRTFRVKVMANHGKRDRAYDCLAAGGDVWAWCIDRFHARAREGLPNANSLGEMWPDQKAHGPFGELTAHCAQDVTKAWSASFFETMRRRGQGERARLPLRKRWLVPVTWRKGEFSFLSEEEARRPRAVLGTARGTPELVLSLSHDHPYAPDLVRSVRLFDEGGELFMDITAWVAAEQVEVCSGKVAGVDPGIIHPLAVVVGDQALLISGRAVRAEEYLHLDDQKARQQKTSTKKGRLRPRPGQAAQQGSRRWKKLTASQRSAEAKNRRRVKLAANRAARIAGKFIVSQQAEVVAIGNPVGIEKKPSGRVQDRRNSRWAQAYTRDVLLYRLEEAGVNGVPVDERGTSSACPTCGAKATKKGRWLVCTSSSCRTRHHRDVAGAQNMVRKLGHVPAREIARTEHRRVGQVPARRDRRRHLYDASRGLARTRAAVPEGMESLVA